MQALLALAMLLCVIVAAQSQQPSPATAIPKGDPPQEHPDGKKQPPAKDQPVLKQAPVITYPLNTANRTSKPDDQTTNKYREAPSEWWIIGFTGVLAVATILQFLAVLWQGRQLKRAVNAAKEEFIATHRPKLIVRCVFPLDIIIEPVGKPIKMYYAIANIGDTKAHIVESVHGIEHVTPSDHFLRLPMPAWGNNVIGPIAIEAGAEHSINFASTITWDAQMLAAPDNEVASEANEKHGVFCTGHIIYEDERGVRRNTVFRRRYYGRLDFCRPVSDPELEYAD